MIIGGPGVVDRRCDDNDVVVRVVTAAALLLWLWLWWWLLRPVLDRGRIFSSESSIPFATATDRYFGWRRTGDDGFSFL